MAFQNKKFVNILVTCIACCCCVWSITQAQATDAVQSKTVKKELKVDKPPEEPIEPKIPPDDHLGLQPAGVFIQPAEKIVVVREKTLAELQAEKDKKQLNNTLEAAKLHAATASTKFVMKDNGDRHVHLFNPYDTDEIPKSMVVGFYVLLLITSMALIVIVIKLYRMRLSRAERKYGVQGDRSTQELTPLPIAIEDINSDDEDQTLFDINRHQIRIL